MLAAVLLLIAARIALPFVVKSYVNHKLNAAPGYAGKIGDVDMKLWRGGYRIHEVEILRKTGATRSPLFSALEVDLAVEWRHSRRGTERQG
jgi:hypothetical protein